MVFIPPTSQHIFAYLVPIPSINQPRFSERRPYSSKENQIAFRILGKLRSTHPPDRIARAHTRTETVSRSINSVNHREDGGRDRVLIPTTPARHQEAICFSRLMKARMEAISDPVDYTTSGNANQNSSWFTLVIVHDNHARLDPHQPVIVNCTIFKHSNQHRFLVL